ncbi:Uncharacterised protein [Vibrio cholerae]|nr:Uncharacterised protein [Vibrio cholerae]CSC64801.1 Uncharacterised protein [Vibrio cholerae]CSI60878.1 Uncharacterised protein [Vibrio cholerae]
MSLWIGFQVGGDLIHRQLQLVLHIFQQILMDEIWDQIAGGQDHRAQP